MLEWIESDLILKEKTTNIQATGCYHLQPTSCVLVRSFQPKNACANTCTMVWFCMTLVAFSVPAWCFSLPSCGVDEIAFVL